MAAHRKWLVTFPFSWSLVCDWQSCQNLICSSLALPSCACARLPMPKLRMRKTGCIRGKLSDTSHSRALASHFQAMICIAALFSLVRSYFRPFIAHHVFCIFSNLSFNISHDKEGLAWSFGLRC